MKARLQEIVSRFPAVTVGVVGDMAADVYIYGTSSRLSREAPVLVVRHEEDEVIPGCSANTVTNVLALRASVRPFALLGDDIEGRAIRDRIDADRIDFSGLIMSDDWTTVSKTRIVVGPYHRSRQQVLRLDREPPAMVPDGILETLRARIREAAGEIDVWIVSDYGYGLVTMDIYEEMRGTGKPIIVDSRDRLLEFTGATIVTPNEDEASDATSLDIRTEDDCRLAGRRLLERLECGAALITRGNHGMALFDDAHPDGDFIPITGTDAITDNTGAGDTVASVMALSIAAGATPGEAMRLANHAAGIVVMKAGAATLGPAELVAALGEA
jgi:D-glycero-beta-D-manno-heptose-7-phosphate kinase